MNALTRLKSVFSSIAAGAGNTGGNSLSDSYASVNEMNEILAERRRLEQLKREQLESVARLEHELSELEGRRIQLLTDSLVDDDAGKKAEADTLCTKIGEKKKQHADIDQVASAIQTKIDALVSRLQNLERVYLRDLGYYLDGVFAELAADYDRKANELAESILRIGALQEVMMLYKSGNSNGFNRRVYLPKIVAGENKPLTAILDADTRSFRDMTRVHQDSIISDLTAAGFNRRFS